MKKILIIEDDIDFRQILFNIFKNYSTLKIYQAGNAEKALHNYFEHNPEIIITDIFMPYGGAIELYEEGKEPDEMQTGYRLIKYIRQAERLNSSKIHKSWFAVITARNDILFVNKIKEVLADFGKLYIKPFNVLILESDIMTQLGLESNIDPILLK
ncbi:MAG: response regulator [Desulfobacterales bacterium]|nr:response regulator [Desulfobacterales bacterium]